MKADTLYTETSDTVYRLLGALKERFRITKAILFGSRARGDHHLHSDLDLLLVSPDFASVPFIDRPAEILKSWDQPYDLEPLCYKPQEYEKLRGMTGIVTVAGREGESLAV